MYGYVNSLEGNGNWRIQCQVIVYDQVGTPHKVACSKPVSAVTNNCRYKKNERDLKLCD